MLSFGLHGNITLANAQRGEYINKRKVGSNEPTFFVIINSWQKNLQKISTLLQRGRKHGGQYGRVTSGFVCGADRRAQLFTTSGILRRGTSQTNASRLTRKTLKHYAKIATQRSIKGKAQQWTD